jgi:hypothetical protein
MLSSAAIAWGVSEAGSTMSRKNQIQPHEQHAECDPGDRYVKQNVHDRGPPRWPSTDLQIYARVYLHGTRFPRTSGNVSTAREPVGILRTQFASGLNYQEKIGYVPQPSHLVCGKSPAHSHHPRFARTRPSRRHPKALIFCCPFHQPIGDP